MIRFYITVIAVFLVLGLLRPAVAQEAGEPAFLQNLNDVPLMPGLYEVIEEGVVFDQPQGRIVEANAAADTRQATEIQSFYSHTLPQLGWKQVGPGAFSREGEMLRIAVQEADSGRVVHFTVIPRP